MPSDKQNWNRSQVRWNELYRAGELSVAPTDGITAVLVTDPTNMRGGEHDTLENMEQEADHVADRERTQGRAVEVIRKARGTDIIDVLRERVYANVVLIALGNIGTVKYQPQLSGGAENYHSRWHDVSVYATHLKQGFFEQRTCGAKAENNLNVPLGWFAASRRQNILAAVGESFSLEASMIEESVAEQLFRELPYFDGADADTCQKLEAEFRALTYHDAKHVFSRDRSVNVPRAAEPVYDAVARAIHAIGIRSPHRGGDFVSQ